MEAIGNYYLISHLVLITGLTDRTIRSYISSGILKGEKINGLWHFTPEQVDSFLRHPAVRPSILAKHHSGVYDFLLGSPKAFPAACMILDIPGVDRQQAAEYFSHRINREEFHNISFSFDGIANPPRVILTGNTAEVLNLINGFLADHPMP